MYWQETRKQPKAPCRPGLSQQQNNPPNQLTFSPPSQYKPPTVMMMMTHAAPVSKQSRTMRYYTKGRGQITLQKNAPHFLPVQTSICDCKMPAGTGVLREACAALHRLSWLLWGGFCYNHNTRSPWSSLASPTLSGGGGERLDIWQGVVWAPRDSKVTPISGDPRASPHHPTLQHPRG